MKASKCTGYTRENKAISPLHRHLIFILHPPQARAAQGVRSGGTPRAEKKGKSWGRSAYIILTVVRVHKQKLRKEREKKNNNSSSPIANASPYEK